MFSQAFGAAPMSFSANPVPHVFEDFISFNGQAEFATGASAARWRVGGTAAATTHFTPVASIEGGVIQVTTATTSGDDTFAQLLGNSFYLTTGRALEFVARFTVDTTTTATVRVGMWVAGSVAGGTNPNDSTDPVGFSVVSDSGTIRYASKGSTELSDIATGVTVSFSTSVFHVVRVVWDGIAALRFYWNDALVATVTGGNVPLNQYLSPGFGISTGSGAAKTFQLDCIGAIVAPPATRRL